MTKDLSKIAKQKKIKYFLISFVDLFGVLRSKLVPTEAIKEMQKNGAGFAGFATWLDMTPADADMFAIPDPIIAEASIETIGEELLAKKTIPRRLRKMEKIIVLLIVSLSTI